VAAVHGERGNGRSKVPGKTHRTATAPCVSFATHRAAFSSVHSGEWGPARGQTERGNDERAMACSR
jgi:hypothetical protein